jgi:hypothetical protein
MADLDRHVLEHDSNFKTMGKRVTERSGPENRIH